MGKLEGLLNITFFARSFALFQMLSDLEGKEKQLFFFLINYIFLFSPNEIAIFLKNISFPNSSSRYLMPMTNYATDDHLEVNL